MLKSMTYMRQSGLAWLAAFLGVLGVLAAASCGVDPDSIVPLSPQSTGVPTTAQSSSASGAGSETTMQQPTTNFPTPPDVDYYKLAMELIPGIGEMRRMDQRTPERMSVGDRKTFGLVNLETETLYDSEFELRLISPKAYWFVEAGTKASQNDLARSAVEFEEVIYPTLTRIFGQEWTPGIDGDPRLHILNASLSGVGGYFSSADGYPREVVPVSNEIEAIYVNTKYDRIGSSTHLNVLTHELHHAIQWHADRSEETWVSEGLAELAASLLYKRNWDIHQLAGGGPVSLTHWPPDGVGGTENYFAAFMFMRYLTDRPGDPNDLRPLMLEQSDGIAGIDAFLASLGSGETFESVFRDWAVANLLNQEGGRYGYTDFAPPPPTTATVGANDVRLATIPQYSNEYVQIRDYSSGSMLTFQGSPTAPLLPLEAESGCWWSNAGDSIDSTLATTLDLRAATNPRLEYDVWYSIEEGWDFAYLQVSADSGATWTVQDTPLTSAENPLMLSYGPGYTGATDGWQRDHASLGPWAGQEIMVRFQYVTDAAINDHGLCLRRFNLSGVGEEPMAVSDWTPRGFAWTNNVVAQDYAVQVVYVSSGDGTSRVQQLELDETNSGTVALQPGPETRQIVVIVQPMAPSTRIPASYSLVVETPR